MEQSVLYDNLVFFSKKHGNDKREDAHSALFWSDFFKAFGLTLGQDGELEKHLTDMIAADSKPSKSMDVFWSGRLLIEQKSLGKTKAEKERILKNAEIQALEYFRQLKRAVRPRHIITCDFETVIVFEMGVGDKPYMKEVGRCLVKNIHEHSELFGFMLGEITSTPQEKVNKQAADLMNCIYNKLKESKYDDKNDLAILLTRLVYCLFADSTGIFKKKNVFKKYVYKYDHTNNTGAALLSLFSTLNTPKDERQDVDDDQRGEYDMFPYVNGDLFGGKQIRQPIFGMDAWKALSSAAKYDWSGVSPEIFGTLFQDVMDDDEQHDTGSHYTTAANIEKVIRPLFLDELWKEFIKIMDGPDCDRIKLLKGLQTKMSNLKFLDPACGSGNFLILTYKKLRELENRIIVNIYPPSLEQSKIPSLDKISKIDVDQFYGIDKEEYAVRIAETGLWIMDHLMNRELSAYYENKRLSRIPIEKHPHIHCKDSLEVDWNDILQSDQCDFILGNPPFLGARRTPKDKKDQVYAITGSRDIDYVSAWFVKASKYASDTARIGLVATNSLTQGIHISAVWPIIRDECKMNIIFAHKSFSWKSDSKKKAAVTVVIIGLSRTDTRKRLFDGAEETNPKRISPYLTGSEIKEPIISNKIKINDLPHIAMGTRPVDDKNFILTKQQRDKLIDKEPKAVKFIRQFVGARDFLHGINRYILHLSDITQTERKALPTIDDRIERVRVWRSKRSSSDIRDWAKYPEKFYRTVVPNKPFLGIPVTSSQKREYLQVGYFGSGVIPGNSIVFIIDADLELAGLLSSRMHMVWVKHVSGRLKSDIRYLHGAYDTFPTPSKSIKGLGKKMQLILDERDRIFKKDPKTTMADIYDPTKMPGDLRKLHERLDRFVEKSYRGMVFNTDEERRIFLLQKYAKLIKMKSKDL